MIAGLNELPGNQPLLETASGNGINIKLLDRPDYLATMQAMSEFASHRSADDPDQLWLLEHPPVYTQGTACDLDTFIPSSIPTVKTDRGGQITYHGPGQLVMYPLLLLKRYGIGVKALVEVLEQSVINTLAEFRIEAERKTDAPGVYVQGAKIAALGLRIRRGTSYHGLSLNIDMDLAPFTNIDPCGYQGLRVTQLKDLGVNAPFQEVRDKLLANFLALI